VVVKFVFAAQNYMLMGVGLGFLGLEDPSMIDCGQMINRAYTNGGFALGLWWWLLPPGPGITFLSIAVSLVGYSFEDEINPRLRRMTLL
jgi:peptide/nickel transport system permease protein